jgi:hypothetical protein
MEKSELANVDPKHMYRIEISGWQNNDTQNANKSYNTFTIEVHALECDWVATKRYSQFHSLYLQIDQENPSLKLSFPGKLMFALDLPHGNHMERRRILLHKFLNDLLFSDRLEHHLAVVDPLTRLKTFLQDTVDVVSTNSHSIGDAEQAKNETDEQVMKAVEEQQVRKEIEEQAKKEAEEQARVEAEEQARVEAEEEQKRKQKEEQARQREQQQQHEMLTALLAQKVRHAEYASAALIALLCRYTTKNTIKSTYPPHQKHHRNNLSKTLYAPVQYCPMTSKLACAGSRA